MSTSIDDGRHRYLDGVRGLACLQVLVNHGLLAFRPGAERTLGLPADGDFAVMLFFVMSGFVLTESFGRQRGAATRLLLSRFCRLLLPVAAACVFAYLLLLAMPQAHARAGELSHSGWLLAKTMASPVHAVADISGVTMWTGTSSTTIFPALAHALPSTESSLDPPIWSMHLELWGSILVLGLVLATRSRPVIFVLAVLLAGALTGVTAMALFVCGFLFAHLARTPAAARLLGSPMAWLVGALLIVAGLVLRAASYGDPAGYLSVLKPYEWYHLHKAAAASLLFAGVLALPPLQRWLSMPLFAWLGKLSYAIYLLHMPILLTLGSLIFVALYGSGQTLAATTAIAIVGILTLFLASLFEGWIDRPAVNFSRRLRARPGRSAES